MYPIEAFESAARKTPLYLERDQHPNPYGHAVAADTLLRVFNTRHGYRHAFPRADSVYLRVVAPGTRP